MPVRIDLKKNGFTLIEMMIVIAIIGLLAAIAIPNFISYRNKTFCSAAENDGNSTVAALSDYYAVPNRDILASWNDLGITTSNGNIVSISGTVGNIVITVTDSSGRCPAAYTTKSPDWNGSIFTKRIR